MVFETKTSILSFWTTLVNACWPHVCDMTKHILGVVIIYLKSLPLEYHVQKCKTHHGGSKKPFFPSTGSWWNNHLQMKPPTMWRFRLRKSCRIEFLPLYVLISKGPPRNDDLWNSFSLDLGVQMRWYLDCGSFRAWKTFCKSLVNRTDVD